MSVDGVMKYFMSGGGGRGVWPWPTLAPKNFPDVSCGSKVNQHLSESVWFDVAFIVSVFFNHRFNR
jgi:hypothetical protein